LLSALPEARYAEVEEQSEISSAFEIDSLGLLIRAA
jgi:hypothetical protein